MKEETKEEYLSRLRKEQGMEEPSLAGEEENSIETSSSSFVGKLKTFFFLALVALFLWAILQIFGMMSGN